MGKADNKSKHDYMPPGWYIDEVFHDPEFNKEHLESILGEAKPPNYFKDKYLISDTLLRSRVPIDEDMPSSIGLFGIDEDGIAIVLRLSKNITKKEYLNSWKLVQWYKKERLGMNESKSKRKSPLYPKLLYAIYKARNGKKAMSFKKIFEKYEAGTLPYYKSGVKPFKYEETLERYYQKYKPRPPAT